MSKSITNMAASVRQRLQNLARERREDFGLLLTKYGLERVLYRIAESKYRDLFILKGALLIELWIKQPYRPTRDADFLARGPNNPERYVAIFKEICEAKVVDDGLLFDPNSVAAERITENANYQGIRVKFLGYLERARAAIQIDLGFGDVITPAPVEIDMPSLINLPTSNLLAYPKESVIAEKFEAMISLGIANSRMKDLYDVLSLSRELSFEGISLSEAIRRTFALRGTPLPSGMPLVFTQEFFEDPDKKKQWTAFCNRNLGCVAESSLRSACEEIAAFLMPVIYKLNSRSPMPGNWSSRIWI